MATLQLLLNEFLGQEEGCGNTLLKIVLCKSTDGSFGRNTEGKENKTRGVSSSENKMDVIQCNQPATRWLPHPLGNAAISVAQSSSLPLAG